MQEEITKVTRKIGGILDVLICLLLFISSLYKGGFYKEDTLFINMIICMLGLVCLSIKLVLNIRDNKVNKKSKIGTIIDSLVLALPVSYCMPVILNKQASMEYSLFEITRYVNFAIIYFIVRTSKNKKIYYGLFVLIAMVMCILGLDEITYRSLEKVLENLSINYLENTKTQISSTLQYANITALVILLGEIIIQKRVIKSITKLKENKNLKSAFKVTILMFCMCLMQSTILLTTSRMNIFLMFVCTIGYAIYLAKKKNPGAKTLIFMTIISIALVASIDGYLTNKNNFMIIITYVITYILFSMYIFMYSKIKDKTEIYIKNKFVVIIPLVIIAVIICFIPQKFTVKDYSENGNYVTRNIYGIKPGNQDLYIKLDLSENADYEINVYEIDSKFNKKIITHILPWQFSNGEYVGKIDVSNDVSKLFFTLTAKSSEVTVSKFKINNKNITLSYMFMPDSLIFRLKDTFNNDSNNILRLTYYKDAIKLVKKSPLVGIGGEGFKSRYQEVQNEGYISSETHSAPMQILVEAGIVGVTIYVLIIALVLILILKSKDKSLNLMLFVAFVVTSTFDLVFSFGLMINLFAVIVGLSVNTYKEEITKKDMYYLDNKSMLGMVKIVVLSISLMFLFITTIYSVNIYRASMMIVPSEASDINESYNTVGIYENKVKLDKYNTTYITNLIDAYDTHITLLNSIYLNVNEYDTKQTLKNEIEVYKIRQKELADNILEYEYYNKYVLEKVARIYLKNYVSYANIYSKNFKSEEIAYIFYIGYAIKLTDRLSVIGPYNKLAHEFAYDIYKDYIPVLEKQNKIIHSSMLEEAINDMKSKMLKIEEKIK